MAPRIKVMLVFLFLFAAVGAQLCLAEEVNVTIKPYRIILTDTGNSETIQALIPMVIAGGISEFQATLSFEGFDGEIETDDFYYCAIDDILHVYFNRSQVIDHLLNKVSGRTKAVVAGSFKADDREIEFFGDDWVEVVKPKVDTRYRNVKKPQNKP